MEMIRDGQLGMSVAKLGLTQKNQIIFRTYLCRKSTLGLEVQPNLFVFDSAKFGAFFALFGSLRAILGLGSVSNPFWDLLT